MVENQFISVFLPWTLLPPYLAYYYYYYYLPSASLHSMDTALQAVDRRQPL